MEPKAWSDLLEKRTRQLQAVNFESFGKARAHTCGTEPTDNPPIFVHALALVYENVLHGDGFTFHAGDLGNGDDSPGTVGQPRHLDHHVNSGGNLLSHRPVRKSHTRHLDHRLQTSKSIARCVGVNSRERAIVTGI